MNWKTLHRWVGLLLGALVLVLGMTGALLAFDPVQHAWRARPADPGLTVATLAERVARGVPAQRKFAACPRAPSWCSVLMANRRRHRMWTRPMAVFWAPTRLPRCHAG